MLMFSLISIPDIRKLYGFKRECLDACNNSVNDITVNMCFTILAPADLKPGRDSQREG